MGFDIVMIRLDCFLGGFDSLPQPIISQIARGHFRINQRVVRILLESFLIFLDGLSRLSLIIQQASFREMVISFFARIRFGLSKPGRYERQREH